MPEIHKSKIGFDGPLFKFHSSVLVAHFGQNENLINGQSNETQKTQTTQYFQP